MLCGDSFQHVHHVVPGHGTLYLDGFGSFGEFFGDVQIPQRLAVGGLIESEVKSPHVVWILRNLPMIWGRGAADAIPFTFARPNAKTFITAKALYPLVIDPEPFTIEQRMQPAIPKARMGHSQCLEPGPELLLYWGGSVRAMCWVARG